MKKLEKILVVCIILLTLIFTVGLWNANKGLWWDEAVYLSLGKAILQGEYVIDIDKDSFRPPLFPFLVAISYPIAGEISVRFVVLLFTIFGIVGTYYLGKTLFNGGVGLLAALLLLSSSLYIYFSQKILTEVVFVTLFSLALTTFYIGMKKRKYLYISAILTGLVCLTRYFGYFLPIIYLLYIVLNKKFDLFKKQESWIAVILFLLTLIPSFITGTVYYGSPIGGIIRNIIVYQIASVQPLNFYFVNSWSIFGLSAILVPVGIYFSLKKPKKNTTLLLIATLLPLIIFSAMPHKETRYFVSFLPAFATLSAFSVQKILNIKKIRKMEVPFVLLMTIFVILGFLLGYQLTLSDSKSGKALKDGALLIKELTKSDEMVISESYPYVNYYADRIALRPPATREQFYDYFQEHNIQYVLVYVFEPGNPEYLIEELDTEKFEKLDWFSQWGQEAVIVYKKI